MVGHTWCSVCRKVCHTHPLSDKSQKGTVPSRAGTQRRRNRSQPLDTARSTRFHWRVRQSQLDMRHRRGYHLPQPPCPYRKTRTPTPQSGRTCQADRTRSEATHRSPVLATDICTPILHSTQRVGSSHTQCSPRPKTRHPMSPRRACSIACVA